MPLLDFREVRPWASAIRTAVLRGVMPPWPAEDGVAFEGTRLLSAREIDVIADWAGGGAPEGNEGPAASPAPVPARDSVAVNPDLLIHLPRPATIEGGHLEASADFTIPAGLDADRWISAWEFRPQNRAIVHDAMIFLELPPGPKDLLGTWSPAQRLVRYPEEAGREIRAGAAVVLRIRYRRPFQQRMGRLDDRSELALWLHAKPPAARVRSLALTGGSLALDAPVRLLAITRLGGSGPFSLVAHAPGGHTRLLLAGRAFDEAWPIQYRLAESLELAGGTRVGHREPAEEVWLEILDAR